MDRKFDPNYQYTGDDIHSVLRGAGLHEGVAEVPPVHDDRHIYFLPPEHINKIRNNPKFFLEELANYVRGVDGDYFSRRFTIQLELADAHWITLAFECSQVNPRIARHLYQRLQELDEISLIEKGRPVQTQDLVQDFEIVGLLKQLYRSVEVEFWG